MTRCRPSASLLAALATVVACTPIPSRDRPGATAGPVIVVREPMAIGFFPSVTQAEVDADVGLASALQHFEFAMADTANCLKGTGIPLSAWQEDRITVDNGVHRDELDLGEPSNASIGCYFVAPHRPAKIVRAADGPGPSSLVFRCPGAAAVYFDVPACCPDGWRCCPDGSVVDAEAACD